MAVRFSRSARCSSISLNLDEPMDGTASTVRRWVLLERPGSWGYDAIAQSRLPGRVARELRSRARSLGVRVVLIRRHGRSAPTGTAAYFADVEEERPRLERMTLPNGPADILDVAWEPFAGGSSAGGQPEPGPLFLVCTNGARDACCAERGRPVARALGPVFADRVWECSHIGGDRFAGNVVCFPHGLYFGRVGPEDAVGVAADYANGVIDLAHFRGRACHEFAVQAAEIFARRHRDLRGVDDVALVGVRRGPGRVSAEFRGPAGPIVVRVGVERQGHRRRLTCRSGHQECPLRYVETDAPAGGLSTEPAARASPG